MFKRAPAYQKTFIIVSLALFTIVWLLPLYFFIVRSFSSGGIENYKSVLALPLLPNFYINSLIIGVSVVAIKLILVIFSAYAFSKLTFPGKDMLFLISLIALMIPPSALLVPLFKTMLTMDWLNTHLSIIGPEVALGLPFAILLIRVAIDGIPKDLFEAAELDGCSHFQKIYYLALPLTSSVLAVVSLLAFLNSWNQYLLPLVFMSEPEMYTVTLSLNYFRGEFGIDVGKIFAAMVLICIPVMILYLFSQKYLQKAMVAGAVK